VASYSPVLKAAFNSDFVEGQTQTYNLEDTTPDVFQLLVQWLYTKSIQFCLTDDEINSIPVVANALGDWGRVTNLKLKCYAADYLEMPRFQNMAVDALEHLCLQWGRVELNALHYLYENVPSEATLRQLILEHCVLFVGHSVYQRYPHLFPKQMLVDLIVAQMLKEELNGAQLPQQDPFTDRAEFIKRFHVPEDVEGSRDGPA
jgi:hypothetical protein